MPSKYLIHPVDAPNRNAPLSKSGIIAREEGCLKCPVCVKTKCVYNVYKDRKLDPIKMVDSLDYNCKNCFRCIQSCPKQLIHKSFYREFEQMGQYPFTSEVIAQIWQQATTGKVPVSGAGYHGPFSGPGFDSMWTDMSEIVRPTRDGIHGREYISTAVDLGDKPDHLSFHEISQGKDHPLVTIPLPILFRLPAVGGIGSNTLKGWGAAARYLGTLISLSKAHLWMVSPKVVQNTIIELDSSHDLMNFQDPLGIEISSELNWEDLYSSAKEIYPHKLIILRVPLKNGFVEVIKRAYEYGIRLIHVQASFEGSFFDSGLHIKDGIRKVHLSLLDMGVRDQVTVLASGGIALAEHVAKAIICGADAVFVDTALQVALECRLCRRCELEIGCPADIQSASPLWVARRSINLMSAWHNQLLEILGAMGIRDIRRLRGETGRAMLFEELERETFRGLNKIREGEEIELS